ncbi:MAG: EAL domain-containing protein [Halioglobus sp.]
MRSSTSDSRSPLLSRGLLLGLLFIGAATFFVGYDGLQRLDNLFYDAISRVEQRPANQEVLIVAIDEKSLKQLGRWPWPRATHAKMIDRLTQSGVSAIGIDILFSERDASDARGDAMLASAIAKSGKVVLVLGPEGGGGGQGQLLSETLPLPELAVEASMLAHVDIEVDKDGICRRVYLRAGLGTPHWPAMGLALFQVAYPNLDTPAAANVSMPENSISAGWLRGSPALISYAGPPGHINRVSYVDVLNGNISAEQLKNKIVLIGTTAVGLGDNLATPVSSSHTLMPGVEVNANLLASILDQRVLRNGSIRAEAIFTFVTTLLLFLGLFLLPASWSLPGAILVAFSTLLASTILLTQQKIWIPPTTPLLLQVLLYIVWSWLDLGHQNRQSSLLRRQIHLQARRDFVTGLPNHHMLKETIEKALTEHPDGEFKASLLVVYMGKHRVVIDSAGAGGINSIRKQITSRLKKAIATGNEVFSLEGEVFGVLIIQPDSIAQLESIAARLVQSLLIPFDLKGDHFSLIPSIGVANYPGDGTTAAELTDNAYKAMHRARGHGVQRVCFSSDQIKSDIYQESRITQELRNQNWREQLTCVYQPQISVATGRIVGVETLLRWHHPQLGHISPSDFISLAEREGMISPIGNWTLAQACDQGQRWQQMYDWKLRIAVNVSAIQFGNPDILSIVRNTLAASGLPHHLLELELTETALVSDKDALISTLSSLKALGVQLAIDDFGTGYSSLAYLKEFPVDRIKIDQSFISDMHLSKESSGIAQSIITIASTLNMQVIAEGVEIQEHLDILRELKCDEVQGYLLGKPMSAVDLENAIRSGELKV